MRLSNCPARNSLRGIGCLRECTDFIEEMLPISCRLIVQVKDNEPRTRNILKGHIYKLLHALPRTNYHENCK